MTVKELINELEEYNLPEANVMANVEIDGKTYVCYPECVITVTTRYKNLTDTAVRICFNKG